MIIAVLSIIYTDLDSSTISFKNYIPTLDTSVAVQVGQAHRPLFLATVSLLVCQLKTECFVSQSTYK